MKNNDAMINFIWNGLSSTLQKILGTKWFIITGVGESPHILKATIALNLNSETDHWLISEIFREDKSGIIEKVLGDGIFDHMSYIGFTYQINISNIKPEMSIKEFDKFATSEVQKWKDVPYVDPKKMWKYTEDIIEYLKKAIVKNEKGG